MAGQLVPLDDVERLSASCIRLLGGNPGKFTLQGTNTYLVGTGGRRLLIDTGEGKPCWKAAVKKVLEDENATVEKVLITHWHLDHTNGIPDILSLCPEATIFKCNPSHGQAGISDGQEFAVDGATLIAVHTPGHTTDHTVFILGEEDAMFTGDNVLGQGTGVFEDLPVYLASLERMKTLFKGRAYPGHGPVIEDGPERVSGYISHRKQREDQVLQTLRSPKPGTNEMDSWTPMELVEVIYQDVPKELHVPASGGVIQILEKLEKERRVRRDKNRWKL
jgi:glyoxylase-like metal-dependent hydrolase (beta-lactamase superfamily II)